MDLGTTSVQVAVRGRGIVLEEPSVVAVDRRTGKILEVGQAARQMLGRTPGELVAVRPLEQGYIADCTMAEEMVSAFLRKALPRRLFKPRLLLCVPSGSAEVAERAVVEAGVRAGARKVYLMEEPLAAALGAGIDIRQPQGHMVVDIGGGTTDVAVTALGGVVASACLATAGDQFDQALIQYVRQHHDLLIGARTAQAVKEAIGQVAGEGEESAAVKGRCLTSGLPRQITLTAQETAEAFAPVAEVIVAAVHRVLERTPPELAADVAESGLLLTGGCDLTGKTLGVPAHPEAECVPQERDDTEILLARTFMAGDKPILAICRGEQTLNVAMGGTHCQHIFDRPEVHIEHQNKLTRHSVFLKPDTMLSAIFGGAHTLRVNSTHHQAVETLAPIFTLDALSEDGVIEAYEYGDRVLATQWHPERLLDEGMLPIWQWFIRRCNAKKEGDSL